MPHKILLIEDSPSITTIISTILKAAHYQVIHAPNGKVGVMMAEQEKPDLILCDIMMPELDGYGVVHILNKNPVTARIPFIFVTSKGENSDFRAGMDLGADDYISKPFDSIDLLRVIELRLKKKELHQSNNVPVPAEDSGTTTIAKIFEGRPSRVLRKKDVVFMEGQTANDVYFIQSGKLKTFKLNYDGKELITRILSDGDMVGFISVMEEKPYHENAEILEDAVISILPKVDFLNIIETNKSINKKVMQLLAANLTEMESRMMALAYHSLRQRVASTLLKVQSGNVITISRKEISNIIGAATESINRMLADFKDEGLIDITDNGLKILQKQKLEKIVNNIPLGRI